MTQNSQLMTRCFELALKGRYLASPNPFVGCVIINENQVISEGFHSACGLAHAEVAAINKVSDKSLLKNSTLIVNLEPCSHHGKTPPCVDAIIEAGIRKVVVGARDTSKKVNGRGIQKLVKSGIEVIDGVEHAKARFLNRRFFTFHEKHRPYIILKWAETAEGFTARTNFESKWISGAESRKIVHQWRAKEMAILVGTTTAKIDNPRLTARIENFEIDNFRQPTRIILDKNLSLDPSLSIFDGSAPTILINSVRDEVTQHVEYCRLDFSDNLLGQLMLLLVRKKLTSLFVEGGSRTSQEFMNAGLWDEARVFKSQKTFETGIGAPKFEGNIEPWYREVVGEDALCLYSNHNFEEHLEFYE